MVRAVGERVSRMCATRLWDGTLADLRIADGRVVEITPVPELGPLAGQGEAEARAKRTGWQVGGRLVLPGLWDHHVHASQLAVQAGRLDLSGATSPADVYEVVREALQAPRPGQVLVGGGFFGSAWLHTVSAADLDAVNSRVPIVLIGADLHSAWLNTAALTFFAERGVRGLPADGLVREQDWFDLSAALPDAVPDITAMRAIQSRAAARGVVGVVDYDMSDTLGAWSNRAAQGVDRWHVGCGTWPDLLPERIAAGLRTGDQVADGVRLGPLKIIADGALGSATALCTRPYPGGGRGRTVTGQERMVQLLGTASSAGIVAAVHAIGDAAAEQVCQAFEATGASGTMEHAQLLSEGTVRRLAALGLGASVQPAHLLDDRPAMERLWPTVSGRAFPLADLRRAGVTLYLGSDAPVAPLDPWLAVSAAVHRCRHGEESWHPEQRLGVAEALAAAARPPQWWPAAPSAHTSAADILTIGVGQRADLQVLDLVPGPGGGEALDRLGPCELATMSVLATTRAGRITHLGV